MPPRAEMVHDLLAARQIPIFPEGGSTMPAPFQPDDEEKPHVAGSGCRAETRSMPSPGLLERIRHWPSMRVGDHFRTTPTVAAVSSEPTEPPKSGNDGSWPSQTAVGLSPPVAGKAQSHLRAEEEQADLTMVLSIRLRSHKSNMKTCNTHHPPADFDRQCSG